jgi:hypothetical protein
MNHSICKQHLHVDFNGSESEARALHGKLSDWCGIHLFPALERALDRCAPANGYWSLERLEIDAGTIAIDRLEQDLPALIEQALEKALRVQTPVDTHPDSLSLPESSFHSSETEKIELKSARHRLASAWFYFLATGTLPWNVRLPEGKNLEQTLLQEWQAIPSGLGRSLRSILSDESARKRLVRQFSEPFLNRLLEQIAPEAQRQLAAVLQTLRHSDLPAETVKPFALALWDRAFGPGQHTETGLIRHVWQELSLQAPPPAGLADLLEQHWPGATGSSLPTVKAKTQTEPNLDRLITGIEPDAPTRPLSENALAKPHPEADEGIYIINAGAVILHPFLPQFFSALNIAENDRLIRPDRALCLLHFLITGQTAAPEYELVLPKVLCNIPLPRPIESDVALTQAELEEADALLEAVIRHWSALKNTGIAGLRGAFLLRPGKITLRDDGDWLLQVENKGYDILLEQLPWGIGAIRLPWMESMLWVEWTF